MSAIGMPRPMGKNFAISAYAEIRHKHLFFERQQSQTLREMEWEGRVAPLTPWSTLIMRGLGVAVLAGALLTILI
jgi:hypothetical protein